MKKLLALILALLMGISLCGCAGGGSGSDGQNKNPSGEGSGQDAAPSNEGSESGEATTITFMAQSGQAQAMYDLIAQFEEQNQDIKVVVNEVAAGNTYEQLVLQTQAKKAPDVYMTFWTIAAATNGLAAELDEFIDAEEFNARFTEAAQGYGEWEGHIYAIPYRSGASSMFVNATLFKEAGIDLPAASWTWEEFYDTAERLTDPAKGVYGFSVCGDSSDSGTEWQYWPFLLQAGGQILDEDNHAAFNSEAGVKALNFLLSMMDAGIIPPGVSATNVDQEGELLASGKLAMFHDGAWMYGPLQERTDKYEILAVPMPHDVTTGSIAGGTALGMAKDSAHKEEAWRFIEFMTSDASLDYWCESINQVSPLREVSDSAYYTSDVYLVLQEQLNDPGTIVANHYVDGEILNSIMRQYLVAAYMGEMSAEDALDAAAAEWNVILDNYYNP